jgi:CRISPR system Cascade subunit CasC
MELVELHILQSFPVTCLNRDDVGAPKSAWFGGVQRARVSSQSWKRAIRAVAKEIQPAFFAGTRTKFVIRDLKERFQGEGFAEPEARELSERTAEALGKLDNLEKGNVKTLLYFSPAEMNNVVAAVLAEETTRDAAEEAAKARRLLEQAEKEKGQDKSDATKRARDTHEKACKPLDKVCEKASKKLKDAVKDAADIGLFGRMVADDHTLTVEGAGLFSHAISTHRAANEVEFFSAVDDKAEPGDEGAAHIDTLEFNSACYYRYVGTNLDLLWDQVHLGHFAENERRAVLDTFLRSAILAVPGARKNSMFGFSPPAFVLGLRRKGQPLSLVNAFEKPVQSSHGYIQPSVEALRNHFKEITTAYGLAAQVEACIPDSHMDAFIEALLDVRSAVKV